MGGALCDGEVLLVIVIIGHMGAKEEITCTIPFPASKKSIGRLTILPAINSCSKN